MKNMTLAVAAALTFALAGCGGKNPDTVEGKQSRLKELETDQARIATEIATLRTELAAKAGAGADTAGKSASEMPKAVTVGEVKAGTFKHFVEVQGQVESDNVVTVVSKSAMPGVIEQVLVKVGDHVTKGQALARIDNAVARTQLAQVQTQLDVAENLYTRQKALWDQKIGSEVQFINAKAQRDAALRQLSTVKEQIAQSTITAPISGTVDQVNARVGESSGNPMGLFRVVNLSDLKVAGNVSESYLPYIRKGAPVEVDFPEIKQTMQGTVSFVSAVVDEITRSIKVEVRVKDGKALRPNMIAKLRVNDQTLGNTVTIDQNLVQNSEQGEIVFVAVNKGGKDVVESRKVKTGLSYNGQIEIKSGLKPGERIITTGYQDVTDGQVVKI